MSQKLLNNGKF